MVIILVFTLYQDIQTHALIICWPTTKANKRNFQEKDKESSHCNATSQKNCQLEYLELDT